MDRGTAEEKDEDNETNDDEKQAKSPVLTPPGDMEECVSERKYDKNEKNDEGKDA